MSTAPTQTLINLPLSLLMSDENVRRTVNESSVRELADSIKATGLAQPILVRPFGTPNGHKDARQHYKLVTGQRRVAAFRLLEESAIPAVVREMTDEEADEIQITENLQREDVPPLEEAEGYAKLQAHLGTATAIAQRVGKEVSYVTKRLQLLQLGGMARKALAERLITIDHALLLARLGPTEQDVNLKWALNPNSGIKEPVEDTIAQRIKERDRNNRWSGYWEPQSVLDLKHHIEEHVGRKLSRAPWDLDAKFDSLPEVPACNYCPSNTKHNDSLFGDLNISAATCENGACFEQKRAAFVELKLAKISRETVRVEPPAGSSLNAVDRYVFPLRLSWKTSTVIPRAQRKGLVDRDGFAPDQVFRYGQWIDARPKSCAYVRQGITVDWSDEAHRGYMGRGEKLHKPGALLTVCVAQQCKVHKKGYASAEKRESGLRNENSAEARADREKWQSEAKAENAARILVIREALDKVKKIPAEILRRLLLESCEAAWDIDKSFPGIEKVLKAKPVDSPEFARAAVCLVFGSDESEFFVNEYNPGRKDITEGRKELTALLKQLGHDASKSWPQPAESAKKKAARK